MYKDDINDLFSQKRESNRFVLIDFLSLYIKMRVYVPEYVEERKNLVKIVSDYYRYNNNETVVLKTMKRMFGKVDDNEDLDEMLYVFDEMAEKQYNYFLDMVIDYDSVLEEYSDFITHLINKISAFKNKDRYAPGDAWRNRMSLRKVDYQVFDEQFKEDMVDRLTEIAKSR